MIRLTWNGIAAFFEDPMGALMQMRAQTPVIQASVMALVASVLVMVIIDRLYGPHAFPHTVQPGGKRTIPVLTDAVSNVARIFATSALMLICTRHLLKSHVKPAEVLWLTVPFGLMLVAFEILQMTTWLVFLATGLDMYSPFFIMGFGALLLVIAASLKTLAPDKDWLSILPVCLVVYFIGGSVPSIVLVATFVYLLIPRRHVSDDRL